jgi:hypothetical protein
MHKTRKCVGVLKQKSKSEDGDLTFNLKRCLMKLFPQFLIIADFTCVDYSCLNNTRLLHCVRNDTSWVIARSEATKQSSFVMYRTQLKNAICYLTWCLFCQLLSGRRIYTEFPWLYIQCFVR